MITCYITFGQKYAHDVHPLDDRAHPNGWFEYAAPTYREALHHAQHHLMGDMGHGVEAPLYAFDYDDASFTPSRGLYSRGCLARFEAQPDGTLEEVTA